MGKPVVLHQRFQLSLSTPHSLYSLQPRSTHTYGVGRAVINIFFSLALQPPWALASAFQFHDHFTDGRTPRTSDQLIARPLPKHRKTQTQNKHIHTPNIHALSGIRTHDPSFRSSEDSSCLRPLGYCDRPSLIYTFHI
jgi:hypothetical protein